MIFRDFFISTLESLGPRYRFNDKDASKKKSLYVFKKNCSENLVLMINVEPEAPGRHKNVRLTLSGGIEFLITSKSFKDSLRFEIVQDFQLSPNVGGILGQVVRPQGKSISGLLIF